MTDTVPCLPSTDDGSPTPADPLVAIAAALLDEIVPGWESSPHMIDTPGRYARWWREFIDYDSGNEITVFPVERVDQIVAVRGIQVWSLCAHHLLPFSATVDIGYVADENVLGLSKFARIAHGQAHRPTSQEELVARIADRITEVTGAASVAVRATGEHLCMTMRGIKSPAQMTTSVTRGAFRDSPEVRAEWFSLLR